MDILLSHVLTRIIGFLNLVRLIHKWHTIFEG